MVTRLPRPALRPFVKALWAQDGAATATAPAAASGRERVLPTGSMHLALRLSDHPLRVFDDPAATQARTVGSLVVGGARTSFYVREVLPGVRSVGAQFHPGAAALLLGVPADELAERHTRLDDLWGAEALTLRAQLAAAGDVHAQLLRLEDFLAARLPRVRGLHPAVAQALARFGHSDDVAEAVRASGYSHRRFIALFTRAVGLPPKRYCRVRRFQALLAALGDPTRPPPSWAALALDAGYSDQPHFNREFRAHVGLSPGEYRRLAPAFANHVPIR